MSAPQVYEIKTELVVSGEQQYPSTYEIAYAINTYAQARVSFPPVDATAEDAAVSVLGSEVMQALGERQDMAFQPRTSPDSVISVNVEGSGEGVNLNLQGFMQAPSFSFSPQSVSIGASIMDECGMADVARFNIYGPLTGDLATGKDNYAYGKTLEDCDWSVPKCLLSIIEDMVNKGDQSEGFVGDDIPDIDKETRKAQHALNQQVFPVIEKICNNSTDFGWDNVFKRLARYGMQPYLDPNIRSRLLMHLCSSKGSFLSTLLDICADFQCFLRCRNTPDGAQYDLCNRDKVLDDPKRLEIPVRSITSVAAAGAGIFPTRYVAVERPRGRDMAVGASMDFVAYPEKNLEYGGTAMPIAAPAWLPPSAATLKVVPDGGPVNQVLNQGSKGHKRRESIGYETVTAEKALLGIKKNSLQEAEDTCTVLEAWARSYYRWESLASSRATVVCPMTKEVQPGERYAVFSEGGEGLLFTGLASSVEYVVQVGSGSNNAANMIVTFTHVEFGNFKLPE